MTRLARLLFAVVLTSGLYVAAAPPAIACSCVANPGDAQYLERADAVFVGEVVDYLAPPRKLTMSSMDPAVWTFAVSDVYKGDVAARQDVISASNSASCGLDIPRTGRFLIFASNESDGMVGGEIGGPVLYASLCSGTRPVADAPIPPELGQPKPPAPGTRAADVPKPEPTAEADPSSPKPAEPTTGPTIEPTIGPSAEATPAAAAPWPAQGPDWATAASVTTGGVAIALVGLWLTRRIRRDQGADAQIRRRRAP